MTPRVYIALSSFARQDPGPLDTLKRSGFFFDINTTGRRLTNEEVMAQAKGFDGIIAGLEPYDARVLEALPDLKCISRCGAGVDNVDLKKAKEKNIVVLNTPDVVVQPVAELTMAMILDLLRRVTAQTLLMRAKKWERHTGNLLFGKKVGVIGLGRIGRRVAQLLRAWDVEVWGVDVRPDNTWALQQGVRIMPLEQVLPQADIVTLHMSVSDEHPFCLGKNEIASMKKGAFLVNVSRGSLIKESSLIEALRSGHLAGAGLDVFEQEPYAGPLCDLPNVILTPHVATLTHESRLQMEIEAARNIIDFLRPS